MRKCIVVLFLLTGKCASETNLSNCQIDLSQSDYVDLFFDHLQAADICSISIYFKKKKLLSECVNLLFMHARVCVHMTKWMPRAHTHCDL